MALENGGRLYYVLGGKTLEHGREMWEMREDGGRSWSSPEGPRDSISTVGSRSSRPSIEEVDGYIRRWVHLLESMKERNK